MHTECVCAVVVVMSLRHHDNWNQTSQILANLDYAHTSFCSNVEYFDRFILIEMMTFTSYIISFVDNGRD